MPDLDGAGVPPLPPHLAGLVEVTRPAGSKPEYDPAGLPSHYAPRVAGYARGPMFKDHDVATVTPSDWCWRNARTVVITLPDGTNYRAVRVTSNVIGDRTVTPFFVGYWAVELLGMPLTIGNE